MIVIKKPHKLLDTIRSQYGIGSDRALAEFLSMDTPVISKLRYGTLPLNAMVVLRVHKATGWPVDHIEAFGRT